MNLTAFTDYLWGAKGRFYFLAAAAAILLFTFLGMRDIWTQEHRWAEIVSAMITRGDFLHPFLEGKIYYDKPLLSYWLIVLCAKAIGSLNPWALRLPSALAGILALWSMYQIGLRQQNKNFGLLSAWLLLTTIYFVFWARVSSADMLNLGGSLFAIAWYFRTQDKPTFFNYVIFFIALALTSLCKGLIGAVIPLIAVGIDVILRGTLKQHLTPKFFLSIIPAVLIYLLPFVASEYFTNRPTGWDGLYLVWRENILRYVQPFDHRGPIYTYFIYLPIYLFPWSILLVPALFARGKFRNLSSRWITITFVILFLFLTVSGSRRSYYVLSIVPFAILFVADWILRGDYVKQKQVLATVLLGLSYLLILLCVVIVPAWYYSQYGLNRFVSLVENDFQKYKPRETPHIVMLDAESKFNFYLQQKAAILNYPVKGDREMQTAASIIKQWPILLSKPANTVFISRRLYLPLLQPYFLNYHLVQAPQISLSLVSQHDDVPIAFVPR